MNLLVILRVALRALSRHKMRSVLTMLGIIIGVGSVITMVGVGQGAKAQVQDRMAVLGTNTLQINAGSGGMGGIRGGLGSIRTLVTDDAEAILRQVPGVLRVTPGASGSVQIIYGN
ncbi:MAG TPA: ABC transporter permease, partial [Bryobacterales bacterium]|nr:ABC transporter permease [Bryobacterales bacterium]